MKKNRISKIILLLITIFTLIPFCPYKSLFIVGTKGDSKIEVQYSSMAGFVLIEDCEELGLKSRDSVSDKGALKYNDTLFKDVTLYEDISESMKITLYGDFTSNDYNRKNLFNVEGWKSGYIPLISTNLWRDRIKKIYSIYLVGILCVLIIRCFIKSIKNKQHKM